MCIENLLNNASVASFVGAFCAFGLVMLVDWRRNRRKKRMISKQIYLNQMINKNKIENVTKHKNNIAKNGQLYPGKMLPFQTKEIKALSLEIIDQFKPEEKLALDAICHHMNSIDELLDEVNMEVDHFVKIKIEIDKENVGKTTKDKLEKMGKLNIDANNIVATINQRYQEALINLNNLKITTQFYLDGKFNKILSQEQFGDDS
jgi:hypothetical protein